MRSLHTEDVWQLLHIIIIFNPSSANFGHVTAEKQRIRSQRPQIEKKYVFFQSRIEIFKNSKVG